jgi:hypothetical protein
VADAVSHPWWESRVAEAQSWLRQGRPSREWFRKVWSGGKLRARQPK